MARHAPSTAKHASTTAAMIQPWIGWASGPVSFFLVASEADRSTLVGSGADASVGDTVDEGLFVMEADAAAIELTLVAVGSAVVNGTRADSKYSAIDMLVNIHIKSIIYVLLLLLFLRSTKLCIGGG